MKENHYDAKSNFLWIDSIVGGSIPANFMPAIEKGFAERIERRRLGGYPVQDVCVEVHFGKVPRRRLSAKRRSKPPPAGVSQRSSRKPARSLLEPVVKMKITVPESHVGDVYSDMSSRGGRVSAAIPPAADSRRFTARCPLREVTTYARTLSSMTGGLGSYTMEFSHYDVMPANIQQDVIASANIKEEDEEA